MADRRRQRPRAYDAATAPIIVAYEIQQVTPTLYRASRIDVNGVVQQAMSNCVCPIQAAYQALSFGRRDYECRGIWKLSNGDRVEVDPATIPPCTNTDPAHVHVHRHNLRIGPLR